LTILSIITAFYEEARTAIGDTTVVSYETAVFHPVMVKTASLSAEDGRLRMSLYSVINIVGCKYHCPNALSLL
jgi:hypothetical protein